ncbi:PREDICTED: peroxisomal N(1)-acetyl-spermine/spermidine oxidase [Papilio xuthus]|uniref:Peroxisomal N(1)-acetyl-spermine/spermidine oxidase n=1 Tax=Papilio xuthus TaxID=66420 RepID=A0A194PSD8_PAPXU|nr:PREDICTED: peroxisomal N(1)-acetyl-spermine/spermidine oxidase [Papilio xuthus]KPI94040.1 Spermine oxidase [Papilio xuthus]
MGDEELNSSIKCETRRYNVIIIGGGMAGLAAANYFIKNGMEDFIILEARNRIGGRIISIPMKNHKVELGANWIHGVLGNPIFEIATANGLVNIINIPKPHKVIAATEDGKQVPFGVLQEIHEAYVCFLRRCEEYFLCQYLPPPDINSVGEHINLEATIYLERLPSSEEKKLRRLIFDCLLKRETCISGCNNMDDIDLLELGSYTELQGGNIMIPSGYSGILEPLKKLIAPEKILTNHPVKKVIWDSDQHTARQLDDMGEESEDSDQTVIEDISRANSDKANNSEVTAPLTETPQKPKKKLLHNVEVICENGQSFYANHVICTIPLGVLKDNANTMFEPALPRYKIESIDRLLFSAVDKIFLEYERPFLNPDITEIMLLWETPSCPEDLAQSWYKKIYSFSKVTETLLLGWVSGKEAEYMETLSMDEVAVTCTKILRKFLNDPFVPEPQTCVCTSWKKQPYTRGSYTAIAVGASQSDIESLAQPLFKNVHDKKPTLLFAGEHTHSSFYSTVHGAYLSGQTAARRLLAPDDIPESTLDCPGTADLNTWIQGVQLG